MQKQREIEARPLDLPLRKMTHGKRDQMDILTWDPMIPQSPWESDQPTPRKTESLLEMEN
jgi:hypothetical protein